MDEKKKQLVSQLKLQPISIGILASNWLNFSKTLDSLERQHLYLLHFDIADGQFSPLFTVGTIALKAFPRPFYKDVHLMVKNQFETCKQCIQAGADILTLQIESDENLQNIYNWIKSNSDALCGISICPNTALTQLEPYLNMVDLIQILTLDPRTGIKVSEDILMNRINQLFSMLGKRQLCKLVSVDGAMNLELARKLQTIGIDLIVSGSAIFLEENLEETLHKWKSIKNQPTQIIEK